MFLDSVVISIDDRPGFCLSDVHTSPDCWNAICRRKHNLWVQDESCI